MLRDNRFSEMYDYLGKTHGRDQRSRQLPLSRGQSASGWSRSQSAAQRTLVILIDNGGVDLKIADLVDKIINSVPASSLLPDSWRQSIRDAVTKFINDPIKNVTQSALEGAELLGNRYNAAKPDYYGDVVILQDGSATYSDLKNALISASNAQQIIDVLILTHGGPDWISAGSGITGDMLRKIRADYGKPLSIRSVYMMNCVGSSLNQAWLDIGAKTSSGARRNNYLPEPTMFLVWSAWKDGKSFSDAVIGAYNKICSLIDDAFGSVGLSMIHARDLDFIKDSEPVVAGDGSLTISSDSLVFTQSVRDPRLIWFAERAMDDAGASALSPAGAALVQQFEGFIPKLYNDPAGHCTIGYGTLVHRGNCNGAPTEQPYQNGVSEDEATRLMTSEINTLAPSIVAASNQPLNQNQFDALASFVYNIGLGAFQKSTLAKKLKAGQFDDVPSEMRKWTKGRVNGKLVDLPGLVKRRKAEADLWTQLVAATGQSLTLSCYGVQLSADKFDEVASSVYGYANYDDFVAGELTATTFLGGRVEKVAKQMVDMLKAAEATLVAQGAGSGPTVSSTFRSRAGLHGLGLAIDLDALVDPYVLNERGERDLDKELLQVYNRIADFMLGASSSCIGRLSQGRSAFNNDIGSVYDSLKSESDAMKRYFALMNDSAATTAFLANEWAGRHAGQTAPDAAAVMTQMRADYVILGGPDDQGKKKQTGSKTVDRPFAPTSSGGRGDPATGFLNLDRAVVMALTGAGLAWGAVDLGGASGDIMHFDCRLSGKGKDAVAILLRR